MLHREHIVNFLRINGIPLTASHDEIRNALIYAKWHERDVEYALLMLSDDANGEPTLSAGRMLVDSNHRIDSKTLSALVGIDVDLARSRLEHERYTDEVEEVRVTGSIVALFSLSVFLAFVLIMVLMFILKIGPYYSPLEQSLF